jgi:hypothetical protein
MPGPPKRRFQISDAMILIAATAVGLGITRALLPDFENFGMRGTSSPELNRFFRIMYLLNAIGPTLVVWTIAVLVLGLIKPRRRLRRLFRQPGAAACASATVAIAILTVLVLVLWIRGSAAASIPTLFSGYGQIVSYAILGGWLILCLTGQWRADPNWLDRLGRLIGLCWFTFTIVSWSSYLLL